MEYYEIRGQRVQEKYESMPYAFLSEIEKIVSRYGQDVADEAMQNLTGNTAEDLISRYTDNYEWLGVDNSFKECLQVVDYMARNYDAEGCRKELVEAELWFYDQGNDDVKAAMNDIMGSWTGADGLIDFIQEIIDLS